MMKSIATPTSTKSGSSSASASTRHDDHHSNSNKIPSVQLTSMQTKAYRQLAHEIVARTLDQETQFRYQDNETLDEKDWKFVRSKERMRVYKRIVPSSMSSGSFMPSMTSINNSNNSAPLLPMVLGVGCMEGKLEDALYGVHHKTTQEMRSVTSFLNKNHKDAAVLANIDTGTSEDPFRYLGLKWRVVETPGTAKLIKNRDVCTLEHLGTDIDRNGNKYGFHLMKSVDLEDEHPLSMRFNGDGNNNVVRAQIMLCCIYRQITPTLVGMYCKAIFDPSGDMMDFVSYFTAAELVLGISKALECAAAKRLTQLALKNNVELPEIMHSTRASKSTSRFTQSSSSANSVFGRPSEDNSNSKDKISSSGTTGSCSVCCKKRSPFFPMRSHTRVCRLCDKLVCAKCCVKTVLFAKPQNVKVLCCKACVIESRSLKVDPRQPLPELGAHDDDDDY